MVCTTCRKAARSKVSILTWRLRGVDTLMTFFSRISRLTVFTGTFNAKLTRFDTLSKLASGLPFLQRTHKTDLDNKNYNNLEWFRHLRKFKKKLNHSAMFAHINIHVFKFYGIMNEMLAVFKH